LCLLAKEQKNNETGPLTFSSIRHIKQTESDLLFLTRILGNLWLSGVIFDWNSYYKNEKRRRIPLPTYPLERKRYWLEEVDQPTDTSAIEVKEKVLEQDTTASKAEVEPGKKQVKQAEKTFEPRPALPNEYVAPDDDIQKKIAAIWEDILGIRPIGIHDNFFDLGGHSLLATLFLSQLQEQFQIRLEMRTIFEEPTIACAAELVKKEQNKTSDLQKIEDILNEVEEEETNEEI
jgi:acyl transferase domain-containing protein